MSSTVTVPKPGGRLSPGTPRPASPRPRHSPGRRTTPWSAAWWRCSSWPLGPYLIADVHRPWPLPGPPSAARRRFVAGHRSGPLRRAVRRAGRGSRRSMPIRRHARRAGITEEGSGRGLGTDSVRLAALLRLDPTGGQLCRKRVRIEPPPLCDTCIRRRMHPSGPIDRCICRQMHLSRPANVPALGRKWVRGVPFGRQTCDRRQRHVCDAGPRPDPVLGGPTRLAWRRIGRPRREPLPHGALLRMTRHHEPPQRCT